MTYIKIFAIISENKKKKKMPRINIVIAPDPLLNLKSHEVRKEEITPQMKEFIQNMIDTMYTDKASGFAAVQFGVHKRIIVLDLGDDDYIPRPSDFYPKVLINPVFTYKSEEMLTAEEACMSVPGVRLPVPRSAEVEIKYFDIDWKEVTLKTAGWLARVIQHEIDHIEGITLLEHMSKLKRDMAERKLKKHKKTL